MTFFRLLSIPNVLVRFARAIGVCLLALAFVAGRAAGTEAAESTPVVSSAPLDQASTEELSADDLTAGSDAPGDTGDHSSEEGEDADESDQQVEEALQTRASLWLACSSYELTFLSTDKGVCRCLQVDPGPARV
ncbi:MAG TPA: hypothetical protein VI072_28480 [Polyangiaceae bacterium]